MNVVINIYTVSGFIVQAFAVMPRSVYQELSSEEINTDLLPSFIRESLVPNGLRCFLAPAVKGESNRFTPLGQGQFPGKLPRSVLDLPIKKESYLKRCIKAIKSLFSCPLIQNHI